MFFVIKSTTPDTDLTIYRARRRARLNLTLYKVSTTEIRLSEYLQKTFKMSLHSACLAILQNAIFNLNVRREIIVTIPDPTLNKIAKIITYGTGINPGSQILKNMLNLE